MYGRTSDVLARLEPGFRQLGLSEFASRAQAVNDGLTQAWYGLTRGPSTGNAIVVLT